MNLLRESWIEPLVVDAVHQSIGGGRQIANAKEFGKVINDESNYRVPVLRSKFVQLLQWSTEDRIPKATVSDTFTTVSAIFSERARNNCVEKHETDIRKIPIGSILHLAKFEITIGQLPSSYPDIHLYVKSVKPEGCEGTGIFGSPKDVAVCKAIVQIGLKLAEEKLDTEEETNDTENDSDSASVLSQLNTNGIYANEQSGSMDADNTSSTHDNWLTQAPIHTVERTPATKHIDDDIPPLLQPHDLLNALRPEGFPKPSEPHDSKGGKPQIVNHRDNTPNSAPSPIPHTPSSSTSSRYRHTNGNSRHERPDKSSPYSHTQNHESEQLSGTTTPPLNLSRKSKESFCQHALESRSPQDRKKPEIPATSLLEQRQFENRGFFTGWNQISYYDVFISKSQKGLIDRPDSWIPPNIGSRIPHGYAPQNLVQEWTKSYEKQANSSQLPNMSPDEVVDVEIVSSSPDTQTPGSPLDRVEWPTSPPTPRVPPDSSPPQISKEVAPKANKRTHDPYPPNNFSASETAKSKVVEPSALNTEAELNLDTETYEDFDIELSIPRGLDTSTQESHTPAESPAVVENAKEYITKSASLAACGPDSMPSQHPQEHSASSPLVAVTVTTPCKQSGDSSSINASEILVPATLGLSAQRGQPSSPNKKSSIELLIHDSTLQNIHSSKDSEMLTGPQDYSTQNSAEWAASRSIPHVVQVPNSSLETANVPISAISNSDSPPQVTSRKRKRTDEIHSPTSSFQAALKKNTISRRPKDEFRSATASSQIQEIYQRFKRAYNSYHGDLDTFRLSCYTLQSLRDSGIMEKSKLWDDYIARETNEYPDYRRRCSNEGTSPDSYEVYFRKNCTVAKYKKRNLTEKNLETVVIAASGTYDSDEGSESGSSVRPYATPEPPSSLPRVIRESPCCFNSNRRESQSSIPDMEELNSMSLSVRREASIELGSEDTNEICPKNSSIRETNLSGREVSLCKEDKPGAGPEPLSQNIIPSKDVPPPIHTEPANLISDISRSVFTSPQRILRQSSILSGDSAALRPPVPILPSHQKAKGVNADRRNRELELASWKDANTIFEKFSRDYARLPCELGFAYPNQPGKIPVDTTGVVLLESRKQQRDGGKMESMGFKLE